VDLWNEWTRFDLTVRLDYRGALEKLQTSISLDDQFSDTYLLLGDYWTLTGNNETDAIRQRTDYEKAAGYYRQAIAAEGPDTPQSLNARLSLGDVELRLGDWDAAIATYEDLLQYATEGGDIWVVYNSLAQAYLNKGDKATALDYASLALNTAPEGRKAEVQALIDTLGK
jgi:tetratricopeptide (TPR) repeat protein